MAIHPKPRQDALDAQKNKTKTALIIHRDSSVCRSYQDYLAPHGYVAQFACTGAEGLSEVYRILPNVVISDIVLPEINGYQLCRLIKNDPVTRRIPFILVSDYEEKMDKFWGFKAGADAFIRHDETEMKLAQQVDMLHDVYEGISPVEHHPLTTATLDGTAQETCNIQTRLTQILDKALIESTLMNEFRNFSDLVRDASLLNYMLFSLLESLVDYDMAALFYNDNNREPRHVTFHLSKKLMLSSTQLQQLQEEFFERVQTNGAPKDTRSFELQSFDVIGETSDDSKPCDFASLYLHNIVVDNTLFGTIAFYSREKMVYENLFPIQLITHELKLLMKLRHLYSEAEMLAITDSLTGLFNYRHFIANLDREFRRSHRYELPLTLAVIDIHGLKQLNEEWGYQLGDEILKHVAGILSRSFRNIDFLARTGGEEMAVILPETILEHAHKACERLLDVVNKTVFEWQGKTFPVTLHMGVASISETLVSSSELLRKGQEALSQAKTHTPSTISIAE